MKRSFLGSTCAAVLGIAACAVFVAGPADAASITLRAGHADSERSVFHKGMVKFKEEVEAKSGGAIKVDVFPSGQLGSIREMVEGIQMGTIDVATAASSVLANFSPEVAVYDLPFLLKDYQHAYRTLDGSVGGKLNASLAANNIKVLGWWPIGFRNVTVNAKKPINSVDEFKGVRIRVMASPIYQEMFRALGADAVPMGWGEVFTALQQGTVDGQENPYINILDANIFEVNKFIVVTEHTFSPAAMMISPKAWGSLKPEQQAIISAAAKVATETARIECEKLNETAKTTLINEKGMKLIALDKEKLRAKTASVYAAHKNLAELVKMADSYK